MCIDIVEAQRAVDKYCDMYPAFQDTRECKLLRVSIKYVQVVCIRTTGMVCDLYMFSLLCRSNLTSVSNTNIHVLGPNGLSELLEARFEFPFILIGKMTWIFWGANHGAYSNPGTQVEAQDKDLGGVLQMDLTRV